MKKAIVTLAATAVLALSVVACVGDPRPKPAEITLEACGTVAYPYQLSPVVEKIKHHRNRAVAHLLEARADEINGWKYSAQDERKYAAYHREQAAQWESVFAYAQGCHLPGRNLYHNTSGDSRA